jgi:hypothetical protein
LAMALSNCMFQLIYTMHVDKQIWNSLVAIVHLAFDSCNNGKSSNHML